jgi:beta-carotene/zeaxanthin 4-ketolase
MSIAAEPATPIETDRTDFARQRTVGVMLGAAVMGGWLALHVAMVWVFEFGRDPVWIVPLAIALQTWLCVGLFIVAHDCMHGSLAPHRPAVNRWFGRLALALYAGLSYDRLRPKHFAHHAAPGTEDDPDFDAAHPRRLWPWFGTFMREYLSLRDFLALTVALGVYLFAVGAPLANVMAFWAVPAWLSALQIFYFGTYLPHREEEEAFEDAHRSRSNDYPWLVSLLTCFHFGYHHEHHRHPRVPWWRLPRMRGIR